MGGKVWIGEDHVPRDHEPAGSPKPKQRPRWGNRCPHVIQVSIPAPHPRYGDKVAHFETSYVRDPDCGCS
jgi:hypothetical protein